MARKARNYHLPDFYHIMVQGDEKKFIFEKDYCKDKYIYLLKRNAFRNDVKIIAYCIMDNHVHVLIYSKEQCRISKMMSQCNTSYGLFFSKERGNVGHVFRDRYRSEPIYSKTHLLNCIKYIHENPVKANIVKSCGGYLFSSFNDFLNRNNIFDEELKNICDITDEDYISLINNPHTDAKYIDDEHKEELMGVLNEIKLEYNFENLNEKDMIKIYKELKYRCQSSKTQVSKLLNIERKKFSKILSSNT